MTGPCSFSGTRLPGDSLKGDDIYQSGLNKGLETSKGKRSAGGCLIWGREGGETAQKFTWEEMKTTGQEKTGPFY